MREFEFYIVAFPDARRPKFFFNRSQSGRSFSFYMGRIVQRTGLQDCRHKIPRAAGKIFARHPQGLTLRQPERTRNYLRAWKYEHDRTHGGTVKTRNDIRASDKKSD